MDNHELQKFIGGSELTVLEAMQKIDRNACGILFIVDCLEKLIGCITDGDIRRYLLAGGKMDGSVLDAANPSPRSARTLDEARLLYHERDYIVIPIVSDDGRMIDLYSGEQGKRKKKHRHTIDIPVVINAGGRGTRLEPYTKVLPKPLIPVGDLPIIEHIMKEYQSYGCEDFHIIVNYKRELLKSYFSDSENHYSIMWYNETEPLGTGGGLSLLRGKINSTFFFANCDVLLTANYNSMLKFHKENGNVITMVCAYKSFVVPYGVVEMGVNGEIQNMKEKPHMSFLINTGIYIVEPEVIDDMEDGVAVDFPDIVSMEKAKGKRVAVFPVSENDWMDMGQLPELEKMRIRLYGE